MSKHLIEAPVQATQDAALLGENSGYAGAHHVLEFEQYEDEDEDEDELDSNDRMTSW